VLTHEHDTDHSKPESVESRGLTTDATASASVGSRVGLHPLTVLRLQQSAGNAAVARLLAAGNTARPQGRRSETNPAEEWQSPDRTQPAPSRPGPASVHPEHQLKGPPPEQRVSPAGPPQPAATAAGVPVTTKAPPRPSPPRRDPGTSAGTHAAEARAKSPARRGAGAVAGLKPLKVAPTRPPSTPVIPAPAPAAPIPTEHPAPSMDTASSAPGLAVGDETEAPARPAGVHDAP